MRRSSPHKHIHTHTCAHRNRARTRTRSKQTGARKRDRSIRSCDRPNRAGVWVLISARVRVFWGPATKWKKYIPHQTNCAMFTHSQRMFESVGTFWLSFLVTFCTNYCFHLLKMTSRQWCIILIVLEIIPIFITSYIYTYYYVDLRVFRANPAYAFNWVLI